MCYQFQDTTGVFAHDSTKFVKLTACSKLSRPRLYSILDRAGPQSDCDMPLNVGDNRHKDKECIQQAGYRYYFNKEHGTFYKT